MFVSNRLKINRVRLYASIFLGKVTLKALPRAGYDLEECTNPQFGNQAEQDL